MPSVAGTGIADPNNVSPKLHLFAVGVHGVERDARCMDTRPLAISISRIMNQQATARTSAKWATFCMSKASM